MIDKYKILFVRIKEMQEERQREKIEQQKREQSINPFSIARDTATSTKSTRDDLTNNNPEEIDDCEMQRGQSKVQSSNHE